MVAKYFIRAIADAVDIAFFILVRDRFGESIVLLYLRGPALSSSSEDTFRGVSHRPPLSLAFDFLVLDLGTGVLPDLTFFLCGFMRSEGLLLLLVPLLLVINRAFL